MSVCDDEAGIEASARTAADWLRDNAGDITGITPEVLSGEVIASAGIAART